MESCKKKKHFFHICTNTALPHINTDCLIIFMEDGQLKLASAKE